MRTVILVTCAVLTAAGVFWSAGRSEHPRLLVSASTPPPSIERCAECHSELVSHFQSAPHHNTLTKPTPDIGKRFTVTGFQPERQPFVERAGRLLARNDTTTLPVDWIFGSGRHAQTPVSVLTGPDGRLELIEHGFSWYPDAGLDATLGMQADSSKSSAGLVALGNHHGPSAAQECFSCHSAHVVAEPGRPPSAVIPGVGCVRCHSRAAQHLQTIEDGTVSLDRWSELSPLESINRCGECHRRPDHFTADELTPENQTLPRFAPVGLSLSACFRQQSTQTTRLDCVSCHDPHAPAARDPAVYRAVCLNCHTDGSVDATDCPIAATDSNCIECHMRKVPVNEHLRFTDHWIR